MTEIELQNKIRAGFKLRKWYKYRERVSSRLYKIYILSLEMPLAGKDYRLDVLDPSKIDNNLSISNIRIRTIIKWEGLGPLGVVSSSYKNTGECTHAFYLHEHTSFVPVELECPHCRKLVEPDFLNLCPECTWQFTF